MRTPAFGQPSGQSAPLGSQANHHGIGRWLAPLVLLVLTGCVQVELYKLPVTSVKAMQPEGPGIAPGASSPIAVVATTKDGKEYVTKGRGMNGVPWSDYSIEANVVKLDGKGNVTLPSDPRESQGRLPHLRITGVGHPDIHADLDIPVRYDWNFQADFSGQDGFRGSDGRDGLSGSDGSSGSTDLEHPSSGGNGSDGGDGSNGDDGGTGGHGSDVHIWVALKNDGTPLLQVKVAGAGREQLFLVNPQGGSLLVKSNGGDGGPGGHGGRGGRGGRGGSGWPSGNSGMDGGSGRDGGTGWGGTGGSITVLYDPQAKPYLGALRFMNRGGGLSGKNGPLPELREETVEALW